jgi:hypothetical protein
MRRIEVLNTTTFLTSSSFTGAHLNQTAGAVPNNSTTAVVSSATVVKANDSPLDTGALSDACSGTSKTESVSLYFWVGRS